MRTPPPRRSGERMLPARARPVPFWGNSLRVLPVTSDRFLTEGRPFLPLARCRTHRLVEQAFQPSSQWDSKEVVANFDFSQYLSPTCFSVALSYICGILSSVFSSL